MPETKPNYRSYLLRLWRETGSDSSWRVMLENIADPGQRQYFRDLESLAEFLLTWNEDDKDDLSGGEWLH